MKIAAADRAALLHLLSRFSGQRILVLADLVVDEYVYGEIARVSREAPVLILKQRERQIVPGGGANAANNLLELGARVSLAGAVGADERGEALLGQFHEKGISTRHVLAVRGYETPTKAATNRKARPRTGRAAGTRRARAPAEKPAATDS